MEATIFTAERIQVCRGRSYSPGEMVVRDSDGEILYVGPPKYSAAAGGDPQPFVVSDVIALPGVVIPGFVDLHTHGAGAPCDDLMDNWRYPEQILGFLAMHGVTSAVATLMVDDDVPGLLVDTATALKEHAEILKAPPVRNGADLAGVYIEGPQVSDLGGLAGDGGRMTAAKGPEFILDLFGDLLKVVTVSPQRDAAENYRFTRGLIKAGVRVAMGHDRSATEQEILGQMRIAAEAGTRLHVTHLYNVMNRHHRNPGIADFALCSRLPNCPEYKDLLPPSVEIVGDLLHVVPIVASAAVSAITQKPEDHRLVLITDTIGTPAEYRTQILRRSPYMLDCGRELQEDNGRLLLKGTQTIAGSVVQMDDVFRRAREVLGLSFEETVEYTSENPARVINAYPRIGVLAEGSRADFAVMASVDDPTVTSTFVAGKCVYNTMRRGPCFR